MNTAKYLDELLKVLFLARDWRIKHRPGEFGRTRVTRDPGVNHTRGYIVRVEGLNNVNDMVDLRGFIRQNCPLYVWVRVCAWEDFYV